MANRRRGRRKSNLLTYVVVIAVICIVVYVAYTVIIGVTQSTAYIESGDMGNQYTAQAVIIRSESLTDTEGLTSVRFFANEGEMAYAGTKIAEVYSSGFSQSDMNKLLSTRSSIKDQIKIATASEYSDTTLDRLDKQALDYARELGMMVRGEAQGNLLNLERQMSNLLTRRQQHFKDNYTAKNTTLRELFTTENTLQKKIQSWTTPYIADRECLISFYTDGWENVLTAEAFDDLSIETAQSVLSGATPPMTTSQRGRTAVYRQVSPSGWYLLLLSNDKNWNPVIGQSYKVQLQGFDDYVFDAVVSTYVKSGNETLVRLRVTGDVRPVLNVRTASAQVGEAYVSGLKVPLNALHTQGDMIGVVLTDNGGIFVPVEVVLRDSTYAVVSSLVPGALWEGQKIQLF